MIVQQFSKIMNVIMNVGINNQLRFDKNSNTLVSIYDDIINAGLRCRNVDIGKIFVSRVAFRLNVVTYLTRKLNFFLYEACKQRGFTFIDNSAVNHNDLWNDGAHLIECDKIIIANNLMHDINHFLQITYLFIYN